MTKDLKQLLQADKNFAKTSKEKGAIEAYKQFLSEDATLLPNNNPPQVGLKNIINFMTGDGSNFELSWSPETGQISKSGDMGYTWGTFKMVIKNDQNKVVETEHGKYLNVWILQNRAWKVIVDMGNLNPAK